MSFRSHAICERCWYERHRGRDPVRVVRAEPTECCFCSGRTVAGIFVRADSKDTLLMCQDRFGHHEGEDKD